MKEKVYLIIKQKFEFSNFYWVPINEISCLGVFKTQDEMLIHLKKMRKTFENSVDVVIRWIELPFGEYEDGIRL